MSQHAKRNAVIRLISETKPVLVIGSPMCTMFSSLQNLNNNRDTPEFRQRLKEAESHVEFCIKLYVMQIRGGRYYLHEHPRGATSWKLPVVQKFIRETSALFVDSNMCAFDMMAEDKQGVGYVFKPIRFMTNSRCLARELNGYRCNGKHRHVHLLDGRAAKAAVYPDSLCKAICVGIRKQVDHDVLMSRMLKKVICQVITKHV